MAAPGAAGVCGLRSSISDTQALNHSERGISACGTFAEFIAVENVVFAVFEAFWPDKSDVGRVPDMHLILLKREISTQYGHSRALSCTFAP
jgi:hypothetical protein